MARGRIATANTKYCSVSKPNNTQLLLGKRWLKSSKTTCRPFEITIRLIYISNHLQKKVLELYSLISSRKVTKVKK